jgi:hypothetical protein
LNSEYHFDDHNFKGSTESINSRYDQDVAHLDPFTFGQILHTAMDFYAHTNWIELGRKDIIDDGMDKWTVLQPFW